MHKMTVAAVALLPATLAAALVAASAQATAPASATAQEGRTQVLRFVDKVDDAANTDIDLGVAGPSAGDQEVFRDILVQNGHPIGTASGVAQVVARNATTITVQAVSTQTLPGGTLTLQTAFTEVLADGPHPFRWAVNGGTGTYHGARGECRSEFINDNDDAVVTCSVLLGP